MNIFNRILARERNQERRLGNPLASRAARERRLNFMMHLMGGKGFRVSKLKPASDAQGRTRGDRKRIARLHAVEIEVQRQINESSKLIAQGMSKSEAFRRFGGLQRHG